MFRVGIQLPHYPIELIMKAGVYADKVGLDSVFTPDHLVGIGLRNFRTYEAFSVLGFLAAKTKRVTLGTCVSDVLRRHPAVLAQAASTISSMSGRTFVLGLGAGEGMNLVPIGISTKFLVSKLEEGAKLVRELLTKDVVNYEGMFFRARDAFIPRGDVKIWVAGNSPRTMEITAKFGDGWVPTATMGEKRYSENLRKIREKAGRKIEAGLFAYTVVAKTHDEAREMIELPGKFIALLSPFRRVFLEKVGIDDRDLPPDIINFTFTRENVEKLIAVAKEIPFELVENRYIYGSPEEVAERMSKFLKAGVEHFVLTPLVRHTYYLQCVKLIAEKVVPMLKET